MELYFQKLRDELKWKHKISVVGSAYFRTQIMKLDEKPKIRCLETHKWENKRKQKVFWKIYAGH